jgi:hypothetical protein
MKLVFRELSYYYCIAFKTNKHLCQIWSSLLWYIKSEWVSDCCLMPNEQFFSYSYIYIMARRSYKWAHHYTTVRMMSTVAIWPAIILKEHILNFIFCNRKDLVLQKTNNIHSYIKMSTRQFFLYTEIFLCHTQSCPGSFFF